MGDSAIPSHLTAGVEYLALELAFVLVLLSGIAGAWRWVRRRLSSPGAPFWASTAEAVVAVPWILFPVLFVLALLGAHRPSIIATQVAIALGGATVIWRLRPEIRDRVRRFRFGTIDAAAIVAVALFVAWGWSMPYPEAFNGHHHLVMNLLDEAWATDRFPVLDRLSVSYDTDILVWPPPFAFTIELFSVPWLDRIETRPVFVLPGLLALVTLGLMRSTAAALGARREIGSLAFLLVAFSYYVASEFTDLTFDLFTPLLLSLLGFALARSCIGTRIDWPAIVIVLAFSALVRPQVFLLAAAAVLIAAAARMLPWREVRAAIRRSGRWDRLVVAAILLPVLTWISFLVVEYSDPLFPQASRAGEFGLLHLDELFSSDPAGGNRFVNQFFPVSFGDLGALVKGLAIGTSFSVLLSAAVVGFLIAAPRIDGQRGRRARSLALVLLAAFALVLYVAFPAYPKFPHYGALLLAPYAALLLDWVARSVRFPAGLVAVALLAAGIAYWAVNSWGHAAWDTSVENVRFLNPSYGTAVDRLARETGRSEESLVDEMNEYRSALEALRPGERILFADHEPGALIPALLEEQFLGDQIFLEGPRARGIIDAKSDGELRDELERLDIRFVYRPGRDHVQIDETLIWRRIEATGEPDYLIPAEELSTDPAPS